MGKLINLMVLCFFIYDGYSQEISTTKTVLLKSTITTVGSYTSSPIDKNYKITHSIGQSGSIGTRKNNSVVVQQGFITHTKNFKIDNSDKENFEEKIDLVLSPNPFVDFIKIDFSRKTIQEVMVQIFDVSGRYVFSEKFQPTESIVISVRNFAATTYLVLITSGKDHFMKKIIKAQ